MIQYPNFIIHSVDYKNNTIFAYTGNDLGPKEQWRWFAVNVSLNYLSRYENINLLIFTSKKQTEKYINIIQNQKNLQSTDNCEYPEDTVKALKILVSQNKDNLSIWYNPLNKDENEKLDIENVYQKENCCEKITTDNFIDYSFYIEDSLIKVDNTKGINDVFVSINQQENNASLVNIIATFTNLYYQGEIVKSIAKNVGMNDFLTRFIFGNKSTIIKIKKNNHQNKNIFDIDEKNKSDVYGTFIGFEDFLKNENYSTITLYPLVESKRETLEYEPLFFCLPEDKEALMLGKE